MSMVRSRQAPKWQLQSSSKKLKDLFLVQHVHASTRLRDRQELSTLDYIFADEENLIKHLTISPQK